MTFPACFGHRECTSRSQWFGTPSMSKPCHPSVCSKKNVLDIATPLFAPSSRYVGGCGWQRFPALLLRQFHSDDEKKLRCRRVSSPICENLRLLAKAVIISLAEGALTLKRSRHGQRIFCGTPCLSSKMGGEGGDNQAKTGFVTGGVSSVPAKACRCFSPGTASTPVVSVLLSSSSSIWDVRCWWIHTPATFPTCVHEKTNSSAPTESVICSCIIHPYSHKTCHVKIKSAISIKPRD